MPRSILVSALLLLQFLFTLQLSAQTSISQQEKLISPAVKTFPQIAEGIPVRSVVIILHRENKMILADSAETKAFVDAFGIKPGASFKQFFTDLAIKRIIQQPDIDTAYYELYNTELSGPIVLVVHAFFLPQGITKINEQKTAEKTRKGFPVIRETENAKLMFVMNGGMGLYNEVNPFFANGTAFTQGNIVANDPANKGVRFWGEAYLEPGIAGITKLGKSKWYGYGSATVLASGRNSADIYSAGATSYINWERLYVGLLGIGIGKHKKTNIDVSYGRQFFQLNDGFLISKFSGSANAGERGSVYLNSRTTFQKTGLAKVHIGKWMLQGFYIEPQELFKQYQNNTGYAGAGVTYNNNKTIDAGIYYINTISGTAKYSTNNGSFGRKGMYTINPKLWLKDIAGTGAFIKSEYAYQSHSSANMKSNAWYVGAGISKTKWKWRPSLYYRYAFMQGDNPATQKAERFDAILTGGLGNWVQGINFRKLIGNGNILSHRVELKAYPSKTFDLSLDYFLLQAHQLDNTSGLAPIAKLKHKMFGQEVTLTTRYFLNEHFMLLGVFSHAKPGSGIQQAVSNTTFQWTSLQAAIFMFF